MKTEEKVESGSWSGKPDQQRMVAARREGRMHAYSPPSIVRQPLDVAVQGASGPAPDFQTSNPEPGAAPPQP